MAIQKLNRVQPNAKKYRVTVRVQGKRLSRTFRSLLEATQWERSFLTARDKGEMDQLAEHLAPTGPDKNLITVGELFDLWYTTYASMI